MTYFKNINSINDLKKEYRKLSMLHHPDNGGDTATMAKINAEYTQLFNLLKKQHNEKAKADTTGKTKEMYECPEEFMDIINALLHLDGLEVELCGSWIWISGNTKEHKEALKAIGCRWASKKKLWYWRSENDACGSHGKTKTMAQIRFRYGSEKFKSNSFDAIPVM